MQRLRYTPNLVLAAVLTLIALSQEVSAQSLILKQTYLNPTPASGDAFGFSVAGLGNDVLIGEPLDDAGALDAGAVYLFDGTTGSLLQTFLNPSPGAGDQFGFFVAAVGNNVLIGAPFDDGGATDAGSAYLFDGATGALLQTFSNPTPALGDQFGFRVSAVGSNVLIGAPFDDVGATDSGVAYLFDSVTGSLLQTFLNPTPAVGDQFGAAVAGAGANALVGAPFDNTGANDAGAAYLMNGATGSLLLTILNPTPAISDQFGNAVAALGSDLVVGAYLDNTGATDAGATYLFNGVTGALMQTFTNPTPANGDQFGVAVSGISSNFIVIMGARQDDTGATNAGSAYIFDGTTGALLQTFNNPTPATGDQFGFSVAAVGNEVLIGAPLDDTGATNAGAAYLYGVSNQPPVADAGPDQTLECASHVGTSVTLDGSASSDPDLNTLTYTWREGSTIIAGPTTSATSVVTLGLGVHTIELTVDDGNGADDTDEVIITIVDTAPPVITLNGANPLTIECHSGAYVDPGATVSDVCDPAPSLVISGVVDVNTPGSYIVTFNASDASGNGASTTRTVNVVDTTPPVITLNGDNPMTIECHVDTYSEPGATVSEACDSAPTLAIAGSVNANTVATYTITYTATDASGNSSSTTRTVNVVDTTPPTIALNGANPMTLECHVDSYSEPGATASDACDPAPSLAISGTVDANVVGAYTITYTATDASSNSSSVTRTVNVVDTTPPVITLNPPMTLWPPFHQYQTISVAQCVASVSDGCAGNIPVSDVVITSVSSDEPEDAPGGCCVVFHGFHICLSGDGSTTNDIVIAADCKSTNLRAERAVFPGNGRVYTINLSVSDPSGNVATAVCKVSVPLLPGSCLPPPVDNGPNYTITSACGSSSFTRVDGADATDELSAEQTQAAEENAAAAETPALPDGFALLQNYPNPFNPATKIAFELPEATQVTVRIFNSLGEQIRTLADGQYAAGRHELNWNGDDDRGGKMSSGVYFYQMITPTFRESKRMLLAK